jgi:CRISPR-associated protein Csx17
MSYLKALGILRLVAEQIDSGVRGAWRNGTFILSTMLDETALLKFFLEKYKPTPIVVPWSGGDFFDVNLDGDSGPFSETPTASKIIEAFLASQGSRLEPYRNTLRTALQTMKEVKVNQKADIEGTSKRKVKARFLASLRARLPDVVVPWIDAAVVVVPRIDASVATAADSLSFNVLLGSGGGSDGNTHFSDNFMQNLWECLPDFDNQRGYKVEFGGKKWANLEPPPPLPGRLVVERKGDKFTLLSNLPIAELQLFLLQANSNWASRSNEIQRRLQTLEYPLRPGEEGIRNALLGSLSQTLRPGRTASLFDSGSVGGPNAGQGMERDALLNPWNFVLAIEGSLCLAGAVARRQGASRSDASAFPFSARMVPTGYGTSVAKEAGQNEIWLPLWERSMRLDELSLLFAEGRVEVGKRAAHNGVDFARAVAGFGVDAGIRAFARYGIVKGRVGGENYNTAVALGQFKVIPQPQVSLLHEEEEWFEDFRRACRDDKTPQRFSAALRRIDSAIFDFCRYGGNLRMAEVLCALGSAERELANGEKFRKTDKRTIAPVPILSPAWISACDDGSIEFRLALALASIVGDRNGQVGDLRSNLEPVERRGAYWTWVEKNRAVVWSSADLCRNLAAVLTRRIMDAGRAGLEQLPLAGRYSVSLGDVARFLNGDTDDRRLEELLWGLLLIDRTQDWREQIEQLSPASAQPLLLSYPYAVLKLVFLPHSLLWPAGTAGVTVKPEPEILGRLRANDVNGACQIATHRLRASGVVPMPGLYRGRSQYGMKVSVGMNAARLAATLLVPVYEITNLAKLVLRSQEEEPAEATL